MLPVRTDDLDYDLPPDRIAATPAQPRDAARLLVVHRDTGRLAHHHVRDLPHLGLLRPGDLIVVNRTRVLPAYLRAVRTATGGQVTGLYLASPRARVWRLMLESRGRLTVGETITFPTGQTLTLTRKLDAGQWEGSTDADLADVGDTPLPPYIRKLRERSVVDLDDAHRYNTIYADQPGSVAAPTAGLHFTPELLAALDQQGVRRAAVTLHVGVGTFLPIRVDDLSDHVMHREHINIPMDTLDLLRQTRAAGGRIVPIGTTTIRALESLPRQWDAIDEDFAAETDLFIRPDAKPQASSESCKGSGGSGGGGGRFRFADQVMTNFHLPRSTLLAMIAALPGVGLERLLDWYRAAIDEGYRFYSYGDAMWLA